MMDKNKLLEELKKLKQNFSIVIEDIESLVENLEVKPVDLEEEFDKCCENYIFDDECEVYTAKHFFKLGFKAKGG
jgi:hypothetical protein